MSEILMQIFVSTQAFVLVVGGITIAEIFLGRRELTIPQRIHGLRYWLILVPLGVVALVGAQALMRAAGLEGIIPISTNLGYAALSTVGVYLLMDFIFYWFHRAQHRFMWRWHAVHHSITDLSAINCYHHWSDPLLFAALVTIPLSLFDWEQGATVPALAVLFGAWQYLIHADLRFDLGNVLIVGQRFHRAHHSADIRDKNFGALVTIWDRLFGTAYFPAKEEVVRIGTDHPQPASYADWSAMPWANHQPIVPE